MNKNYLFTLLALFVATCGMAAPVSRQQALEAATSFMQQKGLSVAVGNVRMAYRAPLKKNSEATAYYVFNATSAQGSNESGQGFVIVSGDDRTVSILGYADKGVFDPDRLPDNMQAWLESCEAQIRQLGDNVNDNLNANGIKKDKAPRKEAEASKKAIIPMLTTTWNQNDPYNRLCPVLSGKRCVTGCVATAMAQTMYFHRANSVGATQAEISGYTTSSYGLAVNSIPAGTTLDWANMLDDYSGNETDEQCNAVAVLMAACGASLTMNYGIYETGGSSASSSSIPSALKTYFGYQAEMNYKDRKDYTIDEWDNMIFNELKSNRPVIYDGDTSSGGHAFVIDGYDGDGLYHVNWGWGGMSDGYFVLSVMNPNNTSGIGASTTGEGYSIDQGAVFGVQPDAFEAEPEIQTLTADNFGLSGNTITAYFNNNTPNSHTVRCGFGVVDANGQAVPVKDWGNYVVNLLQDYYYDDGSFTISSTDFSNAGLSPGTYQLVPVCQMDNNEEWIPCKRAETDYVEAVYADDGTVTLILHTAEVNLLASDFEFPGSLVAGTSQAVNFMISNLGDEFNGVVYFFLNGDYTSKTGVALADGKTLRTSFNFVPASAGTYTIDITLDEEGTQSIGSTQVEITAGSTVQSLEVLSFDVENADPNNKTVVYGTTLKGTAVIRNNASTVYAGDLIAYLFSNTEPYGSFSYVQSNNFSLVVPAGGQTTVDVSFPELSTDLYYMVSFRYDSNNKLTNSNFSTYNMEPGLVIWKADGTTVATAASASVNVPDDATAVNLTGTGVASVSPNQNPNTLYYIGENDDMPDGLDGKNVIRGNSAATIALSEGYDFYVPKTFTATEISFSMTPAITTNGKGGWTTLVLPFEVTSVTRTDTNQPIDWFRSRTDSDKDFWMKSFAEVNGTTALFGYADQHEAYVPYIVAFPGSKWGEEYNLSGKELVFSGQDARLTADARMISGTSVYNFVGTTTAQEITGAFCLNETGNQFARANEPTALQPFRAYFVAKTQTSALPAKLAIGSIDETTTDLLIPIATDGERVDVYDISGTKVRTIVVKGGSLQLGSLPKGVYIIKGKKIVI